MCPLQVLAATPDFAYPVVEDSSAVSWLEDHKDDISELQQRVIARFDSNFCHDRIPGTRTNSDDCTKCDTYKRGGSACNLVAKAFLMEEKTADLAIQNGGGCRTDIKQGPYTVANAFEMLPFNNMMLTVKITGHEVKQVLEDALTNFLTTVDRLVPTRTLLACVSRLMFRRRQTTASQMSKSTRASSKLIGSLLTCMRPTQSLPMITLHLARTAT